MDTTENKSETVAEVAADADEAPEAQPEVAATPEASEPEGDAQV